MKKLILLFLLMPLGLMAQTGNFELTASSKTTPKKVTLIALQLSPEIKGTAKFDFKEYVKSNFTLDQYNRISATKFNLLPNHENEIVHVRVSITGNTEEKKYNGDYSFDSFRELIYSPPASASITITINDSGSATLADIRDALCAQWGYNGAANDNTAKLAFLKQYLINKIVNDYVTYKQNQAAQAAQSIQTQVSVN